MKRTLIGVAVLLAATMSAGVVETMAGGEQKQKPAMAPQGQAQAPQAQEPKVVEGKIKSVDPSGSKITLEDGTQLHIPATVRAQREALKAGTQVTVLYEERDGQKVVMAIRAM